MGDNKKGQTFGDLFSNIKSDTSQVKDNLSFNEISKESNEFEEEKDKKIKSKDIFDEALKTEDIQVDKIKNDSFNDILTEYKEEKNEVQTKEPDKSENKEESVEPDKEIYNIFKEEDNKEKEENIEDTSTINPFFDETIEQEESNNKEDKVESNKEIDNIFKEEDSKEKEENIEDTSTKNPFFDETKDNETIEQEESNNKEDKVESNKEIDNIFKEEDSKEQEENIEDTSTINPLFDETIEQEESNNTEDKVESNKEIDNIFKEEDSKEKEENIEDILNTNPFFIENKEEESEENPFFDNKINLVESNKHTKIDNDNTKIDTSTSKHFNVKIVPKKEPLAKFIIGVLSYSIFIWLLLIGIALLIYVADIKIRAAKGDYSSPTYNAYVVLTGSMLPEIQVYDVVITKKIEPKDLKEGDVITFASSDTRFLNTIITHRIIKKYYDSEKKEYTFQSKGDNNNVADSALVQSNNIYGKVILKIPKLGYLQEFLASKGGWIIAILLPCLAVISYDVVKLAKGLKRKKYKNIKVQK